METGFCCLDHAITGAIYFTFHNDKKIVFRSSKFLSRKNVGKKSFGQALQYATQRVRSPFRFNVLSLLARNRENKGHKVYS